MENCCTVCNRAEEVHFHEPVVSFLDIYPTEKNIYVQNAHRSIIHSRTKMKTAQVSVNNKMDKLWYTLPIEYIQ